MQPMKVCLPLLNSCRYHTQLYTRLGKYLSNYSRLDGICVWILFMWYQKLKAEPTTELLSRESRTNCLTGEVM